MNTTDTCEWAVKTPNMQAYHDTEWGVPVHDDRTLFEFIILDTFQAGLSWQTVLNKRAAFRQAFAGFNPQLIALFGEEDVNRLLTDSGIIRNKLKIRATIKNARCFLEIQAEFGSFDQYIWQFTRHQTKHNTWQTMQDIPASSPEAEAMSKALKKRGFTFVGPTICYAFMQAAGMINDHVVSCHRYNEVRKLK